MTMDLTSTTTCARWQRHFVRIEHLGHMTEFDIDLIQEHRHTVRILTFDDICSLDDSDVLILVELLTMLPNLFQLKLPQYNHITQDGIRYLLPSIACLPNLKSIEFGNVSEINNEFINNFINPFFSHWPESVKCNFGKPSLNLTSAWNKIKITFVDSVWHC